MINFKAAFTWTLFTYISTSIFHLSALFFLLGSVHFKWKFLPPCSLSPRHPLILSLLGAVIFGLITCFPPLILPFNDQQWICSAVMKISGIAYGLVFNCVIVFLLQRQKSTETLVKDEEHWMIKYLKNVLYVAVAIAPFWVLFSHYYFSNSEIARSGDEFTCVSNFTWYISLMGWLLCGFVSVSLTALFIYPLYRHRKEMMKLNVSQMDKLGPVIERNLKLCIITVFSSAIAVGLVTATNVAENDFAKVMVSPFVLHDSVINVFALFYSIKSAWFSESAVNQSAPVQVEAARTASA